LLQGLHSTHQEPAGLLQSHWYNGLGCPILLPSPWDGIQAKARASDISWLHPEVSLSGCPVESSLLGRGGRRGVCQGGESSWDLQFWGPRALNGSLWAPTSPHSLTDGIGEEKRPELKTTGLEMLNEPQLKWAHWPGGHGARGPEFESSLQMPGQGARNLPTH
jgi:hypothetical protein